MHRRVVHLVNIRFAADEEGGKPEMHHRVHLAIIRFAADEEGGKPEMHPKGAPGNHSLTLLLHFFYTSFTLQRSPLPIATLIFQPFLFNALHYHVPP